MEHRLENQKLHLGDAIKKANNPTSKLAAMAILFASAAFVPGKSEAQLIQPTVDVDYSGNTYGYEEYGYNEGYNYEYQTALEKAKWDNLNYQLNAPSFIQDKKAINSADFSLKERQEIRRSLEFDEVMFQSRSVLDRTLDKVYRNLSDANVQIQVAGDFLILGSMIRAKSFLSNGLVDQLRTMEKYNERVDGEVFHLENYLYDDRNPDNMKFKKTFRKQGENGKEWSATVGADGIGLKFDPRVGLKVNFHF